MSAAATTASARPAGLTEPTGTAADPATAIENAPASNRAAGAEGIAVRAQALHKRYGRTTAVSGMNLTVPNGAVLGLLGPNGSGKTTTIRMLLGLTPPGSGDIELLGHPMPDGAAHALPYVGALVEGPAFHPFLSGRENLRRCAAAEPLLASGAIAGAISEALDRVGLTAAADRRFRGYSLGMKQRLGLAAALLVPRRLVMLDEPTNGLDPAGTREVRAVIAQLQAEGTTVVVSSHLLAEIEATCSHVAVLHHGTTVAQGELATMLEAGTPLLQLTTPDPELAVSVLREAGIPARRHEAGVRVELTRSPAEMVLRTLIHADIDVSEARRQRTGLEELFARLTEADAATPEGTVTA